MEDLNYYYFTVGPVLWKTREMDRSSIWEFPIGNQAVPNIAPDWYYNTAKGRWNQSHFVRCILEGLRQARSKPLNYGKLADIEQEEKEAPGKFLDRLKEALCRFTEIDPESEEGKSDLKR